MSDYEFRVVDHNVRPDTKLVEVWYRGKFVASVYPMGAAPCGLRVISKHLSPSPAVDLILDVPHQPAASRDGKQI